MPVLNGIESTKQMRHFLDSQMNLPRSSQPVIIGVTGHTNQEYRDQGAQSGMDEVHSKPFYLAAIKEVLQKYKLLDDE